MYRLSFHVAVRRLHIRLALLAAGPPALLSRHCWLHKIAGCWTRHCASKVLWMGHFPWVYPHTPCLHHASEERGRERTHFLYHRKHHVQRNVEQGIGDWGDCSRGSGINPPWNERSCVSWNRLPNHGFPARQAWEIIVAGSIGMYNYVCIDQNRMTGPFWMDWRGLYPRWMDDFLCSLWAWHFLFFFFYFCTLWLIIGVLRQ